MTHRGKNAVPCNPAAQQGVKRVMEYLAEQAGQSILTGQHTQTREQQELSYIQEVTGALPALCGFELLSYSPNIRYETGDDACRKEIDENRGTLANAMDWAERGGLLTMTWHWFSPRNGKDKSFYTKNTDYSPELALQEETAEHAALLSDMDAMAGELKPFCDRGIPILFRPFHEAEGTWFWWGSQGGPTAGKLYRLMFERYTSVHKLNNLIWVWNSPVPQDYPGDDVVDVLTRDLYPPAHTHTDLAAEYAEMHRVLENGQEKLTAIGEIGTLPSIPALEKSRIPWSWYMTWSNEFGGSDQYTSREKLREFYGCRYAVTLDRLPRLY